MTEPVGSGEGPDELHGPPQIVRAEESTSIITLPDVFRLGLHFEYLRNIVDSTEGEDLRKRDILQVLEDIDGILSNQDTGEIVSELVSKRQRKVGEPTDPDEKISEEQAEEIKKQVTSWIHLFSRDLASENRIPAVASGVLDMDILTERPNELFDPEVWEWLDERPKQDIEEACRSVAVGCATASVMLSLRAVEHCLRKWYEQDNESLDAAWGRVLDRLMEEYAEEDKRNDTVLTQLSDLPPVLTSLYYLKEKRNEVNHPEESPSPREARRTLLIVSSTITEIYEVMRDEAADEAERELEQGQATLHKDHEYQADPSMTDTQRIVMDILRNLERTYSDGVPRGEVYDAGSNADLSADEIDVILQDMLMDGRLYEPSDDTVKII